MMFEIFNRNGASICFQKADNAKQAVEFARMYGHKAFRAVAVKS